MCANMSEPCVLAFSGLVWCLPIIELHGAQGYCYLCAHQVIGEYLPINMQVHRDTDSYVPSWN